MAAFPSHIPEDFQKFIVISAPPLVYYLPDFITEQEEAQLLQQVYQAPRTKWRQLSGRRLQNWGGLPHPKGTIAERLPGWLQALCDRMSSLGAFGGKSANHVLVNEYKPGQGILPHQDGPLYHPTVTTVSLGSHTLLDFYEPLVCGSAAQSEENRLVFSLLLEPRSLLILQHDVYQRLLHGIRGCEEDVLTDRVQNAVGATGTSLSRGTRVSLTVRHVPNVIRNKLLLARN